MTGSKSENRRCVHKLCYRGKVTSLKVSPTLPFVTVTVLILDNSLWIFSNSSVERNESILNIIPVFLISKKIYNIKQNISRRIINHKPETSKIIFK